MKLPAGEHHAINRDRLVGGVLSHPGDRPPRREARAPIPGDQHLTVGTQHVSDLGRAEAARAQAMPGGLAGNGQSPQAQAAIISAQQPATGHQHRAGTQRLDLRRDPVPPDRQDVAKARPTIVGPQQRPTAGPGLDRIAAGANEIDRPKIVAGRPRTSQYQLVSRKWTAP